MKHEMQLQIVRRLLGLPHSIVSVHGRENVPEFVLHEICTEECFNIPKAAYFVDNPDFDTFRGVCGYSDDEQFVVEGNIWAAPDDFTNHMSQAKFNKAVREKEGVSPRHKCACDEEIVDEIAQELGIKDPWFHSWPLKYGNHGLLIFEADETVLGNMKEDIHCACHMLSMCPVF
jgi:hypothetical protein